MDFLILYEHAQRELENACLLKCELERRGYKVKIDYYMSLNAVYGRPKVLVLPHLYDDFQVAFLVKNRNRSHLAVVDLQYEQILEGSRENISHHTPSGQAVNAYHSAWGDAQVKRYLDGGIPASHICKTGSIGMDLNDESFNPLFLTRRQIADKYGLCMEKKWVMLLANFSLCSWTEEETAAHGEFCGFRQLYLDKRRYMLINQKKILEWVKRLLESRADIIFIYRPHPAEFLDGAVRKACEENSRFYIISDYSVRQWTRVADVFFTYYSTSLADVYFAKKFCGLLFPVEVPEGITAEIIEGAEKIRSYAEMEEAVTGAQKKEFPVSSQMIDRFYGEWRDGKAYRRIADMCERALCEEIFQHNYVNPEMQMKDRLKQFGKYALFSLGKYVPICKLLYRLSKSRRFERLMKEEERELYPKARQMKDYCANFNKILSKN